MNRLPTVCEFLLCGFPACLDDLDIGKFIVDAVTAQNNVVVVVFNFETLDVWRSNDNLGVTLVLYPFRLDITKGPRH